MIFTRYSVEYQSGLQVEEAIDQVSCFLQLFFPSIRYHVLLEIKLASLLEIEHCKITM